MSKLFPQAQHKQASKLRRVKAPNGTTITEHNLDKVYSIQLESLRPDSTLLLAAALDSLPDVEYAEPNYIAYISGYSGSSSEDPQITATETMQAAPSDETVTTSSVICDDPTTNPLYNLQYGITYEGLPELWKKPVVNGKRPVIAIIDTGVDINHPDLKDNIWTNEKEAEGEPDYDNDGNGFKGDVHGWDFVNNSPNIRDYNSHGTHCAGIAAAADNGIGVIGANPKALIMPVTVMQSDGEGDYATIAKGIDYAVENGATVLSMSLGGYNNSQVLRQALENAYGKAVLVAAAGNDALAIYKECDPLHYGTCFPAAYSFVLGVEALQTDSTFTKYSLASFSNFDCDGPNYSAETSVTDPEGFNYELMAPGRHIASTIPDGKYRYLSGTSMAAPLVAGAISALEMVKNYDSQEILWGDLTHSATILGAYNIKDRPAELDFLGMQMRDRKELTDGEIDDNSYATNDGEADAGETLSIYPIIRTTFGVAKNIEISLKLNNQYEDTTLVSFVRPTADFGMSLSAYSKGVSKNPLQVKLNSNIADGRHIQFKVVATADGTDQTFEQPFTITVSNMHKIGGLIDKDTTLTADKTWYVTSSLGIAKENKLIIEPGTRLEFEVGTGLSCEGQLIAKGTPNKPIIFTGHGDNSWRGIQGSRDKDTLTFCKIYNFYGLYVSSPFYMNCDIIAAHNQTIDMAYFHGSKCTFRDSYVSFWYDDRFVSPNFGNYLNFANNIIGSHGSASASYIPMYSYLNNCNYLQRSLRLPDNAIKDKTDNPSYLGTSREDIVHSWLNEKYSFGRIDFSNMRKEPYHEAHGIVWKVVVDGKDAQDEYEQLAPLGVGRHQFCVWFNRPMNVNKAPQITFGVRDPYTQVAVAEDGSWSEDSTKYTAYITITGKTSSDGINQIYVRGAEDNEFFECPYEKTRFRVQVQAAGSMATGFMAEPGLGKVTLTWNNEHNDFADAMGFNVYRISEPYQKIVGNDTTMVSDTICLNQSIVPVDSTSYIDYDVVAGKTYSYYYKVLSTDLKEYDISNVVAATVLSSEKGDANGSGSVDVADVITTVNYSIGDRPKPFLFEAADMNSDKTIDVLDVVGIIEKILGKDKNDMASSAAVASYSIENGILYVDAPVALAGVQVQVNMDEKAQPQAADDLNGFENAAAWLSDNDYIFLAYNMNGKTLTPGRHAILNIGNADLTGLCLSDAAGHNVQVVSNQPTNIDNISKRMRTQKGIFSLDGRKLAGDASRLSSLPSGVYIVNGEKVVK